MRTAFRIALALVLMVGFTSAATAQMTIAIGPKAGVNFANFTGDDVEGLDVLTGFAVGAVADFRINDMWSIMPEAYYSMQGSKDEEAGETIKVALDYVRVPILVKFTIPMEGSISPYLFVGPEFGFKVSCDVKNGTSVDCDEALDAEIGIDVSITSFDYGVAFGGGVGFALGSGTLTLDARYALGLADVIDVEGESVDMKNSNIHLAVAYLFSLGN